MKIPQPHDALFKAAMSDLSIARAFLQQHLPPEIYDLFDFNTLQLCSTNFFNAKLRGHRSDVLFSVKFKHVEGEESPPRTAYFLIEHQSTSPFKMSWRMVEYLMEIIKAHQKATRTSEFPLIIPIVVYTGNKPYSAPVDFYDLFGQHKELARQVMFNGYQLIDISHLSDQAILKYPKTSPLQWAMKHVHDHDFIDHLDEFAKVGQAYFKAEKEVNEYDYQHYESIVEYLLSEANIESEAQELFFTVIRESLPTILRSKVMSLAQHIEQKGYQRAQVEFKSLKQHIEQKGYQRAQVEFKSLKQHIEQKGYQRAQVEFKSLKQHIEQRGFKAGFEQAQVKVKKLAQKIRTAGLMQGIQRGQHLLLERQLIKKFGNLATYHQQLLKNADEQDLLSWSEYLLEAKTLEEVFK